MGAEAGTPDDEAPASSLPVQPLRVLVTDDNPDAAESMAMLLRLTGHEVRTALDGPATLALASSFQPHAIFLDIGLPRGMDGYEVARRLRRQEGLERVLLVAIDAWLRAVKVTGSGRSWPVSIITSSSLPTWIRSAGS